MLGVKKLSGEDWTFEPVPRSAMRLFRMCWQLETWLRTIVYVELRASRLDWEIPIQQYVRDWPPRSIANDKRLHHMATPHQAALSYLTFGQLWSVISDATNWPLFEPYFPPKENAEVRINEVNTIRNRVAHFRDPHPQDEARLELFVRDMDPGIRRFCSRYIVGKVPHNPAADPVLTELESVWERDGYGIELRHPGGWLYEPTPHTQGPLMNATLDLLTHRQYSLGSSAGVIYAVRLHPKSDRMNVVGFFEQTKSFHKDIIHIMLSSTFNELSVTIPAVHGPERTAELVLKVLSVGLNSSRGFSGRPVNKTQVEWPEYVLWPDHILTFYCDEIQEPILDSS